MSNKKSNQPNDLEIQELDAQMKAAGMLPLSSMLNGNPIMRHAGVNSIETFEQWLRMRHSEMLKMKARMMLKTDTEENDMFEWVLSHEAALGEVLANFQQAMYKAH
jgi:hypothetical protein